MAWRFFNSNGEALVQHAESEATQAEMEGESAVAKFVPPDLVKNSPGVAKGWCVINADGTIQSPDYNVASITDVSTGVRDVVWDTDFSTNVYAAVATLAQAAAVGGDEGGEFRSFAVGSVRHTVFDGSSVDDAATSVIAFGDQ